MLTTEKINKLIGVKESYQAPDKLKEILFDKERREKLFLEFIKIESDVSYDWFNLYFQKVLADRDMKKQDFTPPEVSNLLSRIVGSSNQTLEIAAGTGGLIINKWWSDCMSESLFTYFPSNYFYQIEELSDATIPFLLFNLLLRGMNATVVHGDSLTREVKQIYFIQNVHNDALLFSSLNVMPHNSMITSEFNVKSWLEDEIDHIEDENMPDHLPEVRNA